MRKYILSGVCLAFAAVQQLPAQDNKVEFFGGWTYARVNPEAPLPKANMNGWAASVNGYANSWFGVGGEFSAVFGDIGKEVGVPAPPHAKEYSYLFGPQFRFVNKAKTQVAFRALLGGSFAQARLSSFTTVSQIQTLTAAGYSSFDQTKFAALFAVPIDVSVTKVLAFRFEPGLFMSDFNHTKQANFRMSIGPVLRFGGR